MEELGMSRIMKIQVGDKEYKLGYPTRKDAKIAEANGVDIVNNGGKMITLNDKLFFTGLLANHPSTTEYEAIGIMEAYKKEGGDINEVINFLTEEYMAFFYSSEEEKIKKRAKIIEM